MTPLIQHDQYCHCDICKSIVSITAYGQVRRIGSTAFTAYNDDGEFVGTAETMADAEELIEVSR